MKIANVSKTCLDGASYVPETFRLNIKSECTSFFKKLNK